VHERPCKPFFEDDLRIAGRDVRVYRCDWGWYVKAAGGDGVRSRFLDEALEAVLRRPLDRDGLLVLVETLDRELTAERDAAGRTASRVVREQELAG
jgi:hypothetical protein